MLGIRSLLVLTSLLAKVTSQVGPNVTMDCDGRGLSVDMQGVDFTEFQGAPYAQSNPRRRYKCTNNAIFHQYDGGLTSLHSHFLPLLKCTYLASKPVQVHEEDINVW